MENTMGGIIVTPAVNMHADKMSDEHINMFDTVFKDIDGAGYFPLLYVGSQLVAGQFHTFIALRRFIHAEGPEKSLVKVIIFQSLNNDFAIHSISEF